MSGAECWVVSNVTLAASRFVPTHELRGITAVLESSPSSNMSHNGNV